MYQLSLDQLHSSQMMLMEHKSLNSCSNNIIKKGIFKYYNKQKDSLSTFLKFLFNLEPL